MSKSFFDYSDKEKKKIIQKAAEEGAKMQRDMLKNDMEDWEKEFDKKFCVPCIDYKLPNKALLDNRLGVLKFIRSLLQNQHQHDIQEFEKIIGEDEFPDLATVGSENWSRNKLRQELRDALKG